MKIRNGFVSNSSSSSFVFFLNEDLDNTNSVDAIFKELFPNNKPEDILYYEYSEREVTLYEVAEIVKNKMENISLDSEYLFTELDGRYQYFSEHLSYRFSNYYGTDKALLKKTKNKYFEWEKLEEEKYRTLVEIEKEFFPFQPIWSKLVSERTDYEMLNEKYQIDNNTWKKTNKKYKALERQYNIKLNKISDEMKESREMLVKEDIKALKEDTKGKFAYYVSFSDNQGEEHLEHGNIFRNVKHMVFSHH